MKHECFFNWLVVQCGSPRLRLVGETMYNIEKYLDLTDFDIRSAISKLRVSAHPLEIEKGRYKKLPVCERICKYCNLKAVEDETHFISNCSFYENTRNDLSILTTKIYPYFPKLSDEEKSVLLLNTQNPHIMEKVGHYVFHGLQKRSQTLQT